MATFKNRRVKHLAISSKQEHCVVSFSAVFLVQSLMHAVCAYRMLLKNPMLAEKKMGSQSSLSSLKRGKPRGEVVPSHRVPTGKYERGLLCALKY